MNPHKTTHTIQWQRWPWLLVAAACGVLLFVSVRAARQAGTAALVSVAVGVAAALVVSYLLVRSTDQRPPRETP